MMRLKLSADFPAFLRTVKGCTGAVHLKTSNGDSLELHSALCQLIAVVAIKKLRTSDSVEILCENDEDYEKLKDFLTQ